MHTHFPLHFYFNYTAAKNTGGCFHLSRSRIRLLKEFACLLAKSLVWKCVHKVSFSLFLFQPLWDLLPTIFKIGRDLHHRKKWAETLRDRTSCNCPTSSLHQPTAGSGGVLSTPESSSRPRESIPQPILPHAPSQRPPTHQPQKTPSTRKAQRCPFTTPFPFCHQMARPLHFL